MKSFKIIVILTLFFSKLIAQPDFNWLQVFGNPSGGPFEFCYTHTTDNDGNVYAGGSFISTGNFDIGGSNTSYSSNGMDDAYIVKYDSTGSFKWAVTFGSTFNDVVHGIAYDGDSSIYVTGSFNGNVDFDPDTATFILNGPHVKNIFVARYSTDGDLIWAFKINGVSYGRHITCDNNGGIYITGSLRNATDFDPGPGVAFVPATSNLSDKMFLAKYDEFGQFHWVIHGEGDEDDYGIQSVFHDGYVYWTGGMSGNMDLSSPFTQHSFIGFGGRDVFIHKVNASNGLIQKSILFGGNGHDLGRGIAVKNDRICLTGYFRSTADFDASPATFNLISNGEEDAFIAVYDTLGNFIGARSFGDSSNDDTGYSVSFDATNDMIISGRFMGTINLDLNGGNHIVSSPSYNSGFLAKYDEHFNFRWAFSDAGGSSHFQTVTVSDHNIWISGLVSGMVDFDPSSGVHFPVVPNQHSFVAKYQDTLTYNSINSGTPLSGPIEIKSVNLNKSELSFIIESVNTGRFSLLLYNTTGEVCYETPLDVISGSHYYSFDIPFLTAQIYLLQFQNARQSFCIKVLCGTR